MTISNMRQAVCFRIVVSDDAEARSLGVDMLNNKVAYSVSIHPNVETHYLVNGSIQEKNECVMEAYVDRAIMGKTAKWLQANIKDAVPQVSVYAVLDADDRYLNAIYQATRED